MKDSIHFDVILRSITETEMTIDHQDNSLVLTLFPNTSQFMNEEIGQIGFAEYDPVHACWRFNPYLDQSLRRVYEADTPTALGWSCDTKPDRWVASSNIVPGKNGDFVQDQTVELTINIPPEFIALCDNFNQTPERMLRGFIADACGLRNLLNCPREDSYTSNGSDERRMAYEYLERAHGHNDEVD